jgi:hypothetical protein
VTWADLQLSGHIIFTAGTQGVDQLDLASGAVTSLFQPADPQTSWALAQTVAPDGRQMIVAYAPPPEQGQIQFGYTHLYRLAMNGPQALEPLIPAANSKEAYFDPTWSPDGKFVYYTRLVDSATLSETATYQIERLSFPGGQPEAVVDNAFWPRLSADGSALVYVTFDPLKPANQLYVASADGQNPRHIDLPAQFQAVDSPFFSLDGDFIYFSAISTYNPAQASWLDRLLGVQTAFADGSPADWWRVPAAGGPPQLVAEVLDTGMYGVPAPDGRHIAYISGSGLYVMNLDGRALTALVSIENIPGSIGSASVDWLP